MSSKSDDLSQPANWLPATRLVHGGTLRSEFAEMSEALFLTQGYVYDSADQAEERFKTESGGFIYSRYANPTVSMLEERMKLLEGAEAARCTASGMAAISASLLCFLKAGDHVVAARALFGSCLWVVQDLLPRYGVEATIIDGRDIEQWKKAVRPNTRACFFETPSNPCLELVDIRAVSEIAHSVGALVVVDNVFASPLYQRPMEHGADVVVYSATKHIDGQGRVLGGIVLGSQKYVNDHFHPYYKHTGGSMSPFNAWVLLKSLETMPLRIEAQTRSAGVIADHLASRIGSGIARVLYPGRADHPQAGLARQQMTGGSTLVSFDLEGGKPAAFRFLNALSIIKISNNLGDAKSMVTHPATTTHQRLKPEFRAELGITDGLVRLSVGLEATDDLKRDIDRALSASRL
ncbi:MAG: O-succinylhomoserine sulfhydrylase [Hyphomicrobiaceae bacterium]